MATWKKIITSGSNADLNQITASAVKFPNDSIPIASLAEDAITIAGSSTALGGSITSAAILNNGKAIISGSFENGMTVSGNISASGNISGSTIHAQTLDAVAVTDVLAAAVVSEIDNDEIPIAKLAEDAITIAGSSTALGSSISSADILNNGKATVSGSFNAGFSTSGHITASGYVISASSFVGDGSGLTGVGFQIDELSNTLTAVAQDDLLVVADNDDSNEEKKITFSNFEDEIFGNVSGDIAIAAGGAATISSIASNLIIGGDLTVNGTTTTISTTNTLVQDQFMFLGTGSAATNTDIGIIVQSGSSDLSGSALYHDTNSERWSVAKTVKADDTAVSPLQFVTTVRTATNNPNTTTSASYGAGEMHVNTDTGDIWIRTS